MRKRRAAALLMALLITVCCASCGRGGREEPEDVPVRPGASLKLEAPTPAPSPTPSVPQSSPAPESAEPEPLSISVDQGTGELTISRPESDAEEVPGDPGWTIFVYMCGSDLESEAAMATDDLLEMAAEPGSEDVRFVVQAGGSSEWYLSGLEADTCYRILAQEGELYSVWESDPEGMGRSGTLKDFLVWGAENYASEHMGLVFWDHGGGSITGVCFDELDDYDSLSLREMDEALLAAYAAMGRKFDFIGFDACLMSTLETANILASYSNYMYASQELEPGSGWDYSRICEYLTGHTNAAGEELGRFVCDSFREACIAIGDEDDMTICVVDLSAVDGLIRSFNTFAGNMYSSGEDPDALAEMVKGIQRCENFGGNNRYEGYTNMVDLLGLVSACSWCAQGSEDVLDALSKAVVYSVNGPYHSGAGGLSVYYPLCVQGSTELAVFGEVCVSPWYLAFVDRQSYGLANEGSIESYDAEAPEEWFWSPTEDSQEYWSYLDDLEEMGDSPLITFETEPCLDEDGYYYFVLDENGLYFTLDVVGYVYQLSEDGEDIIELGETLDVYCDWDTGYCCDEFDGYWLSLPDGQNLALGIADYTDEYVIYTSPILLNDRETNLRLRMYNDGTVTVEGAWDGVGESGAADRDVTPLEPGDVIVPMYWSYSLTGGEDSYYVGWDYVVTGDLEISYSLLDVGDYYFGFCIDDIFGDWLITDYTAFSVDWDGEVYYYTDE